MKKSIVRIAAWLGVFFILLPSLSNAEEYPPPPSLTLASPTLEVNFPVQRSLVQFFYIPQVDGEEPNVEVFLSYRTAGEVQTSHLETLQPEGRAAEIATVFTLDADGDRERELFMVVKWPISHVGVRTEGGYYKVYVYRRASSRDGGRMFARAYDIERQFGSGFDGTQEGETVSFPYKDFQSIRAAISR